MRIGRAAGGMRRARPGGSAGARVLIAIAIALFALVRHYSRTEVNPVTGEKQRVALSTSQEIALGVQAAPRMAAKMGGVVPDADAKAALVDELGARLAQASGADRSPYRFEFHLLGDDRTVNAFALPGGQIFVTRALFDRMENEAQLAGVIGHEIGHVIHRHGAEHMATAELAGALSTAVGVGAADEGGSGMMARAAAQMAAKMLTLKYGRADELESDAFGLEALVQAGYDPAQMLGVMRVLAEAGGGRGRGTEFLSTHPHPESRVEQIRAFLAQRFPERGPSGLRTGRELPGARRER